MTANNFERVNLSPLLLGNTEAKIKVNNPVKRTKEYIIHDQIKNVKLKT